jgi:hypothetical protein
MPSPEEQAYSAVERAYGQGSFRQALELAEALQLQLQPQRSDLLDQRLQLLIGHIHLYGLEQHQQAEKAYRAVLQACSEPAFRQLAEQNLERCGEPAVEAATPLATAEVTPDLPATPWLQQLDNPQQALADIQQAWIEPEPQAAAQSLPGCSEQAATPWGEHQSEPASNPATATEATAVEPLAPAEKAEESQETGPAAEVRMPQEPHPALEAELDRGLLLVRLSGRGDAAAADPLPERNRNQPAKEPPETGGSWKRIQQRWLGAPGLSWLRPNDGDGSGR